MRLGWCKQEGRHWLALLCVMLCVQACTTTPHLRKVSSKLPPIRERVAPPERRSPRKKSPQKKRAPFAKGVKLCQQSRWEEAEAYFLAQKKRLTSLSKPQRATLFLFLGVSEANLLRTQKSSTSFVKALLLDPCIQLPPVLDLSPQIQNRFKGLSQNFTRLCKQEKTQKKPELRDLVPPNIRGRVKVVRPKIPDRKAIKLVAWLVMGSGVLTLGAACVTGGLSVLDELERNRQPLTPLGTEMYLLFDKQAKDRALLANVLFGSAGVFLFTGFMLHVSQALQVGMGPEEVRHTTTFFHERQKKVVSSAKPTTILTVQ